MRTFRRKVTIREKELIVVKGPGAIETSSPHTCPLCNSPIGAEAAPLMDLVPEAENTQNSECLLTGDIKN